MNLCEHFLFIFQSRSVHSRYNNKRFKIKKHDNYNLAIKNKLTIKIL